jgi:hypothetical protein
LPLEFADPFVIHDELIAQKQQIRAISNPAQSFHRQKVVKIIIVLSLFGRGLAKNQCQE